MDRIDGERRAADLQVDLEAVAAENTLIRLCQHCLKLGRVEAELLVGHMRVAGHADEFDRLPVAVSSRIMTADVDAAQSLPEVVYLWR